MSERDCSNGGPVASSIDRLRQEFERWLESAWSQGEKAADAMGFSGFKSGTPAVNVYETPDQVLVVASLPGVPPEGFDLTLVGNMLTIAGTYAEMETTPEAKQHQSERPTGPFHRSVPLPATVDADSVSAECSHGVLTVTIEKSASEKPRKIPVNQPTV